MAKQDALVQKYESEIAELRWVDIKRVYAKTQSIAG
jgi:hypothetical protein